MAEVSVEEVIEDSEGDVVEVVIEAVEVEVSTEVAVVLTEVEAVVFEAVDDLMRLSLTVSLARVSLLESYDIVMFLMLQLLLRCFYLDHHNDVYF